MVSPSTAKTAAAAVITAAVIILFFLTLFFMVLFRRVGKFREFFTALSRSRVPAGLYSGGKNRLFASGK